MSRRVAGHLNTLSPEVARAALGECCGASAWVERMAGGRPFASDAALFEAADRIWWALAPGDWLEAFARHPRIGERNGGAWSTQEQSAASSATDATRKALAQGNREYEKRFGHVFLICATGLSADQMLGELTRRLANDPARELHLAAAEQAKITRLRLEKLVTS